MPPLLRQFVRLLLSERHLSAVRTDMLGGKAYVWMRDPETFRQLDLRSRDNQELNVQEQKAMTAVSNIRHMLVLAIAPVEQPTTLGAFLDNLARPAAIPRVGLRSAHS